MGGTLRPAARRALVQFAEHFYRRVFPPEPERDEEQFDFGEAGFLREYVRASQDLLKGKGVLPEYIFLVRAEVGLYETLHRLRARVATSRIVRRYLQRPSRAARRG
jgi:hypothetical protein